MSRKRFIKLAMSHGLQRNEAELLSLYVGVYGSYSKLYEHNKSRLHIKRWTTDVQNAAVKLTKSIIDFYDKFKKSILEAAEAWKSILTS